MTATVLVVLGGRAESEARAGRAMLELLRGSEDLEVVGVYVSGRGRQVICDDNEVCAYLTKALRRSGSAWSEELKFGNHSAGDYDLRFALSSGAEYQIGANFGMNGFRASVPAADPVEDGYPTHVIIFEPPVPERLAEIVTFLEQPYHKVAGQTLRVTTGQPTKID